MFGESQQNGDVRQLGQPANDLARATLAQLDRTVSEAISGNGYALEELRMLWPALRLELPAELTDQARDEYLAAAIDIWTRYRAQELPDLEQAAAALEVLCLLFDH